MIKRFAVMFALVVGLGYGTMPLLQAGGLGDAWPCGCCVNDEQCPASTCPNANVCCQRSYPNTTCGSGEQKKYWCEEPDLQTNHCKS